MTHAPHPLRIQRSRRKGATHPPGTVFCTRPSDLSNPFVGEQAVEAYRWLANRIILGSKYAIDFSETPEGRMQVTLTDVSHPGETRDRQSITANVAKSMEWYFHVCGQFGDVRVAINSARGKPVACFCPLDKPCHADVIAELANR